MQLVDGNAHHDCIWLVGPPSFCFGNVGLKGLPLGIGQQQVFEPREDVFSEAKWHMMAYSQ